MASQLHFFAGNCPCLALELCYLLTIWFIPKRQQRREDTNLWRETRKISRSEDDKWPNYRRLNMCVRLKPK